MSSDILKRRIKKSLVKRSAKPTVSMRGDYSEEYEYAEAIPTARCHNIELNWNGNRFRFRMDINDHPMLDGEMELGCIYGIDSERDEWVEAPHDVLESAKMDQELMGKLNDSVIAIENDRKIDDGGVVELELYMQSAEDSADKE